MANLRVIPAKMSCAEIAKTTEVAGQGIGITKYQTASASAKSPQYCAITGHINTYIGFEILLPIRPPAPAPAPARAPAPAAAT
jgi:hypothetical protein